MQTFIERKKEIQNFLRRGDFKIALDRLMDFVWDFGSNSQQEKAMELKNNYEKQFLTADRIVKEVADLLESIVRWELFVLYDKNDQRGYVLAKNTMKQLVNVGLIEYYDSHDFMAGSVIDDELNKRIYNANALMFLLSVDCLNNDNIRLVMENVCDDSNCRQTIVPILLKHCQYKLYPIGRFLAYPKNGIPISRRRDKDKVWNDIVQEICNLINN